MDENDARHRLGKRTLHVNAHGYAEAVLLAMQGSPCFEYEAKGLIGDELATSMEARSLAHKASESVGPDAVRPGAWAVHMVRIERYHERGAPHTHGVSILALSCVYSGPRPIDKPDACDDPVYWAAARRAFDERGALDGETPETHMQGHVHRHL